MSKNPKNYIRPEFMKNFTRNIETRYVLVDKGQTCDKNIENTLKRVSSLTNQIAQELNIMITKRQIPYITLTAKYNDIDINSRIGMRNLDTPSDFEKRIKEFVSNEDGISHFIDCIIAPGYNDILISDLACSAQLLISKELIIPAFTDILLDIIMFNSYSF